MHPGCSSQNGAVNLKVRAIGMRASASASSAARLYLWPPATPALGIGTHHVEVFCCLLASDLMKEWLARCGALQLLNVENEPSSDRAKC